MAQPRSTRSKEVAPKPRWKLADSLDTYGIERWGCGFFSINDAGNIIVTPRGPEGDAIDLKDLVDDMLRRGLELPLLLRFSDILHSRIELLTSAFARAIEDYGYKGSHRGVYPIKVNQTRRVVDEIVRFGSQFHYGFEAGSKPELLAVMAMHEDEEGLIVCNGYKDADFIETALLASRLGRTIILVVEKLSELDLIHQVSQRLGVRARVGIRAKLTSRGAGRWESSGGDYAKFGLAADEMVEAVERLRAWGELECLELLHFHLGSQISSIRAIKDALREAGRLFVELWQMGSHGLRYFDVGGGLGVDYDGSQTNYGSSINYSVQEYANDVVFAIQELCDAAEAPHPTIVTESGRAITAHHSVLVVDVLGVSELGPGEVPATLDDDTEPVLRNLVDTYEMVSERTLRETYHDALEYKEQVLQLFNLGHLSLETRVQCERLFWAICKKILGIVRTLSHVPDELQGLERMLCDTYFCNFSMFQSLPDAWAVDHQFPIAPIHRLGEEPTRRAIMADITCDSDGRIDSFITQRGVKKVLELHPKQPGEPYYLGVFLVGAYQEILGDLHNLFGDQHTVHVALGEDGDYDVEEVVEGDTIAEVLHYVDYSPASLLRRLRRHTETALRRKLMTLEESRQLIQRFQQGLGSYTYLHADPDGDGRVRDD